MSKQMQSMDGALSFDELYPNYKPYIPEMMDAATRAAMDNEIMKQVQQGAGSNATYIAVPKTGFDFNKVLIYGGAGLAAVLVLALALRR